MDTGDASGRSCRLRRAAKSVRGYTRHRPEETVLYRVVGEHLEGFYRQLGEHGVSLSDAKKDASFVQDTGLMEDRGAACSIQAGLASGANEHLTFGRYEKAAVHFHSTLTEHLRMLD